VDIKIYYEATMLLRLAPCILLALTSLNAQPPQGLGREFPMQGPALRMAAQPIFNDNCASCYKSVISSADPGPVVAGGLPNRGSRYIGMGNGIAGNVSLSCAR
jgi:hypothetical protein